MEWDSILDRQKDMQDLLMYFLIALGSLNCSVLLTDTHGIMIC